jgi:hypothetical protein
MKKKICVIGVAMLAVGLAAAAPAGAWTNDSEKPGSVLVFPKFIRGVFNDAVVSGQAVHARTEIEISVRCPDFASCAANETVRMRAHWVCPGCTETSFDLETTVNGSLYFNTEGVTVIGPVVPVVTAVAFPSNARTTIPPPNCPRGYLIVWVIGPSDEPIKFDGLIGDAILRDGTPGEEILSAQGYNAVPIQAAEWLNTGDSTNQDGEGDLDFDGNEYQAVAGRIFGTVRYENLLATGGTVRTDLTLLTLDVRSNEPNPLTTVKLNFYTTDEDLVDTATSFQCWVEQRLTQINSGLIAQRMGRKGLVESTSATQHLDFFTTQDVTVLGIVETRECIANCDTAQIRDYAYSLYHDGNPVPTAFKP